MEQSTTHSPRHRDGRNGLVRSIVGILACSDVTCEELGRVLLIVERLVDDDLLHAERARRLLETVNGHPQLTAIDPSASSGQAL